MYTEAPVFDNKQPVFVTFFDIEKIAFKLNGEGALKRVLRALVRLTFFGSQLPQNMQPTPLFTKAPT